MLYLKLSLQIKRDVTWSSEVDLSQLPFLFHYQENESNVCIHADSFKGNINGFTFPFNAVINHKLGNGNYDLCVNGVCVKMFKSDGEITLINQDGNGSKSLVFEVCG